LLSLQSAVEPQVDSTLIRIYINTRASTDPLGLAEREQSGKDLATALSGKKKKVTIVDDEDKADVVLELEARRVAAPKIVIGIGPRPGDPTNPASTVPSLQAQLRVKASLVHADESNRFSNKNRAYDNPGGWKSVAEDIARQLEKWVTDRRAKILAARPKTSGFVGSILHWESLSTTKPEVLGAPKHRNAPPDILVGMKGQRI